jgi:hypothetical protein
MIPPMFLTFKTSLLNITLVGGQRKYARRHKSQAKQAVFRRHPFRLTTNEP